jgi:hypothetical protein
MSSLGIIAQQEPEACEACGLIEECRPYGPNDENICFDCAMATLESKAIAELKMAKHIFGEEDEQ